MPRRQVVPDATVTLEDAPTVLFQANHCAHKAWSEEQNEETTPRPPSDTPTTDQDRVSKQVRSKLYNLRKQAEEDSEAPGKKHQRKSKRLSQAKGRNAEEDSSEELKRLAQEIVSHESQQAESFWHWSLQYGRYLEWNVYTSDEGFPYYCCAETGESRWYLNESSEYETHDQALQSYDEHSTWSLVDLERLERQGFLSARSSAMQWRVPRLNLNHDATPTPQHSFPFSTRTPRELELEEQLQYVRARAQWLEEQAFYSREAEKAAALRADYTARTQADIVHRARQEERRNSIQRSMMDMNLITQALGNEFFSYSNFDEDDLEQEQNSSKNHDTSLIDAERDSAVSFVEGSAT